MTRCVLLALLIFSQAALSESLWGSFCDRLLRRSPEIPVEVAKISGHLESQVHRVQRYGSPFPEVGLPAVEYLEGTPRLPVVTFRLQAKKWLRAFPAMLVANPNYLHLDWSDTSNDLGGQPALLAIFEDLELHTAKGEDINLVDLMAEQVKWVKEKHPELDFQLHWVPAHRFTDLKIKPRRSANLQVAWVEGRLQNYQLKRISLLMMQHALRRAAQDPRFAEDIKDKKP